MKVKIGPTVYLEDCDEMLDCRDAVARTARDAIRCYDASMTLTVDHS